jgi:transcriptional regulator with XRE-family HTH domain
MGRRIRLRRVEIGLSQSELGEKLGVSFQQVQKYEKGVNRVGASRLQQITEALGVDMTFFYEGNSKAEREVSYRPKLVTAGIGKAAYRGGA